MLDVAFVADDVVSSPSLWSSAWGVLTASRNHVALGSSVNEDGPLLFISSEFFLNVETSWMIARTRMTTRTLGSSDIESIARQ